MDYFYIGKIENKLKKLKAEAGNSRNKLNNVNSKSKIEKSEISLNLFIFHSTVYRILDLNPLTT